jgi:hypothetical protein
MSSQNQTETNSTAPQASALGRLRFNPPPPTTEEKLAALGEAFVVSPRVERRKAPRVRYQVVARLELDGERPGDVVEPVRDLHTRDLGEAGAGFITPNNVVPGERAVLNLPSADGEVNSVTCRVRRARPIAEGWFEGYVEFEDARAASALFSEQRIQVD